MLQGALPGIGVLVDESDVDVNETFDLIHQRSSQARPSDFLTELGKHIIPNLADARADEAIDGEKVAMSASTTRADGPQEGITLLAFAAACQTHFLDVPVPGPGLHVVEDEIEAESLC